MLSIEVVFARLLLAAVLGGLIGLERESHNRPAGLRTNILVCVGSAVITLVSIEGFGEMDGVVDPSRVAANIVTGIGFLGAGTIMRYGGSVQGLTTAAAIWVVAGIGMAVGTGYYWGALASTFIVIVSLLVLPRLESRFIQRRKLKELSVEILDRPGQLGRITTLLGDFSVSIMDVKMGDVDLIDPYQMEGLVIQFLLRAPNSLALAEMLQALMDIDGVLAVRWQGEPVNRYSVQASLDEIAD
ncbi:MAG: MgtC/SapB family protein [Firmicutes bacterium]|nr:MgtC/SapB family protein [Bacillota bacterium]